MKYTVGHHDPSNYIFLFVLFLFAQYYSVCLFDSVLLCKVMSTQSAINNGAYNHQIHPSPPVHQTWWSRAVWLCKSSRFLKQLKLGLYRSGLFHLAPQRLPPAHAGILGNDAIAKCSAENQSGHDITLTSTPIPTHPYSGQQYHQSTKCCTKSKNWSKKIMLRKILVVPRVKCKCHLWRKQKCHALPYGSDTQPKACRSVQPCSRPTNLPHLPEARRQLPHAVRLQSSHYK